MIKMIVMTGMETLHLQTLYFSLLKKYLPIDYQIDLLLFGGLEGVTTVGGLKVNYVSLGEQKDFLDPSKDGHWFWSDAVLPYFQKLPNKIFFLTWLEHLPICPADVELFRRLAVLVGVTKAQKAVLDTHLNTGKFAGKHSNFADGIIRLGDETMYRTTLMPSIWKHEYLMKYLKPGMTSWDFELENMRESMNDGATILAPKDKNAYTIFDFYKKGLFNKGGFDDIKEDLDPIERRNILDTVDRFGKQARFR